MQRPSWATPTRKPGANLVRRERLALIATQAPVPPKAEPFARDLDVIRAEKTLRVLFTFNSRILDRFEHYKAFVEKAPELQ